MKKKLNVYCAVMLIIMAIELIRVVLDIPGFTQYACSVEVFNGRFDAPEIFALATVVIIGLLVLYAIIRGFISFVKFIINVNRNEIFEEKNIPLLRWTGWGILVYNLFVFPSELINYKIEHSSLLMSGIRSVYVKHEDAIILAVFCWIIAEVFAIGIRLREEQELTI